MEPVGDAILGRYLFEKRDHESTVDAIAQFEEAIRLDPGYGPAWLGLAYTYVNWPDYDLAVNHEAMYDKALQVVGQGIAADPGIRQEAGTVYGFVYHKRKAWIAAAKAFETAINAETEQPIAHHWYSYVIYKTVHGIVTGSVQIIDDQVRIAAFLEDTRSGLAICCDTFDATRRNIFETQKQVAGAP